MISPERFTDQKLEITDFLDEILVVCPRCSARASVEPLPGGPGDLFSRRRLTCVACGYQKEKRPRQVALGNDGEPVDSFFSQPLWLVAQHGTDVLWAYNIRHLEYIEAFVRAAIRTRQPSASECSNRSVISRLPRWIKKASNRKRVLSMILELKESAYR